jgi:hypothetical protein
VCQVGNKAAESARTIKGFIWGFQRHYSDLDGNHIIFSTEENKQDLLLQNPHAIGSDFGKGVFSGQFYMPKQLFEETDNKSFFDDSISKGKKEMESRTCEIIFSELTEYVKKCEGAPQYIRDIYNYLENLRESSRTKEIQRLFVNIEVGPQFDRVIERRLPISVG